MITGLLVPSGLIPPSVLALVYCYVSHIMFFYVPDVANNK